MPLLRLADHDGKSGAAQHLPNGTPPETARRAGRWRLAGDRTWRDVGNNGSLSFFRVVRFLWLRGGFPDSFLAKTDRASLTWREDYIRTYLERDIPSFGLRIPAETLRRFWMMLPHEQGGLLNAAKLAGNLGVSGQSVARYLDLLVDLMLVRRLPPWHSNAGKRLVKSSKVYIRDSGLTHALLGIGTQENLFGHPVVG